MPTFLHVPIWIWGAFLAFVVTMLALDLGVFHRKAHVIKMREALIWSAVWIALALAFNVALFYFWPLVAVDTTYSAKDAALAFFTGYLVEKALSVDNIFVFLMVFAYFQTPPEYQHRVLFWGILGALIFRAIFIFAGAALLTAFTWTMVIFGLFLIFTGIKMAIGHGQAMDISKNPVLRFSQTFLKITPEYDGQKFFTRIKGVLYATPLFLTLLVIEFTDIIFAVDSIPAIFAITTEPFIVFTSNVFAILGLRALFFAVAGLMRLFEYLSYGLSAVLVFVGGKMVYNYFAEHVIPGGHKFPIAWSLGLIGAILALSIGASIYKNRRAEVAP
jgi:tellurite resistance protein TerC